MATETQRAEPVLFTPIGMLDAHASLKHAVGEGAIEVPTLAVGAAREVGNTLMSISPS